VCVCARARKCVCVFAACAGQRMEHGQEEQVVCIVAGTCKASLRPHNLRGRSALAGGDGHARHIGTGFYARTNKRCCTCSPPVQVEVGLDVLGGEDEAAGSVDAGPGPDKEQLELLQQLPSAAQQQQQQQLEQQEQQQQQQQEREQQQQQQLEQQEQEQQQQQEQEQQQQQQQLEQQEQQQQEQQQQEHEQGLAQGEGREQGLALAPVGEAVGINPFANKFGAGAGADIRGQPEEQEEEGRRGQGAEDDEDEG